MTAMGPFGLLLCGGRATATPLADAFTWNGVDWTSVPALPAARSLHGLCYDSRRQRVVVYGGEGVGGTLADTLEFDGLVWTQRANGFPSGLLVAGLVFDERRGRSVLIPRAARGAAWEWDGASWLAPVVQGPVIGFEAAVTWQPDRQRTLVVHSSGSPWIGDASAHEWDGTTWYSHAYDARLAREGLLLYADPIGLRTRVHGGEAFTLVQHFIEFVSLRPATVESFGLACAGAGGQPSLQADGLPWLGDRFDLVVGGATAQEVVVIAIGDSRTSHLGTSLPLSLAAVGYPACSLRVGPIVTGWLSTASGRPSLPVPVPARAALVGTEAFAQAFVWHPPTGALGATPGLRLQIGQR